MKKFLFILIAFLTLASTNSEARGIRIRVPVHETVPFAANLPDSSYYTNKDGEHLDLGYIEENDVRTLVFYSKDHDEKYYDIPADYVEIIQRDMNVDDINKLIPEKTFWDKYGYTLLTIGAIIIIAIGVWAYLKEFILGIIGMFKKKDE